MDQHRSTLSVASAISSILCILTLVIWVRSHYVRDIVDFGVTGRGSHTLQSILGRVHIVSTLSGARESGDIVYGSDRLSQYAIWNGGMSGYPNNVEWFGDGVFQRYDDYTMSFSGKELHKSSRQLIVLPYWWLGILFSILPATVLMRK